MNWQKITLNSLAAMEVLTAGNGAENAGTPGRGGQHGHPVGLEPYVLDVTAWHEDGRLRLFTTKQRRQQRPPPELLQPGHLRARSSRTSSGSI